MVITDEARGLLEDMLRKEKVSGIRLYFDGYG